MTRGQKTGMAIITAAAIIITMILLTMCSCSTTEHVVEHVTVHDTVFALQTDTVKDIKVIHLTDTVKWHEIHTYTVNLAGDTVRENHHLVEHNKTVIVDSTYRYQSERDSLRQALHEAQSKEKTVVKEKKVMAWWGWLLLGIMAGPCLMAAMRLSEKK